MQTSIIKNELLNEISEKTGLRFSGKSDAIGGAYEGYNITINCFSNIVYINIPIRITNEYYVNEINDFLRHISNKYNYVTLAQYICSGIKIQCSKEVRQEEQENIIIVILNEVVNFAKERNLVTCCEECGQSNYVVPYIKDGFLVPWCVKCQLKEKEKEVASVNQNVNKSQGPNLISGIIGAIIGAFLGAVIWIIISQIGYISSIGGLAIAIGTIKGYEILGHGMDKNGLIISIGIIIVTVYLAQYGSIAFEIYRQNRVNEVSLFDSIKLVHLALLMGNTSTLFYRNLVLGYLFTLVPSAYYIKNRY